MDEQDDIREKFAKAAARFGPAQVLPAVVTAVNDDHTVQITFSDGSSVDDARLKSVVKDGDHFVSVPAVDSVVLVGRIENSDEWLVLSMDAVSEIKGTMNGLEYSLNEDGMLLKNGTDTLLMAMEKLTQSVQQIVVMHGTNPDYVKLQEALLIFQKILR